MKTTPKAIIKNEKGFAMLEGLAFMMAFVVLTIYTMDTFSAIHTGIVNNISARGYLFETLQHRANIRYLRSGNEDPAQFSGSKFDLGQFHERFHTVTDEEQVNNPNDDNIRAAGRRLTASDQVTRQFPQPLDLNGQNQTPVIWVKSGYGICIDAYCQAGE